MKHKEEIAIEVMFSEKTFGEVMGKWRTTFGIKQKELAKELDMTFSVVSDYERNRRSPSIVFARDWILALCKLKDRKEKIK
jgi:putative transcriptional regulator